MNIVTRSQAIIRGMKRYFSGRKCIRGHMGDRYTSGGRCVECLMIANVEAKMNREHTKKVTL